MESFDVVFPVSVVVGEAVVAEGVQLQGQERLHGFGVCFGACQAEDAWFSKVLSFLCVEDLLHNVVDGGEEVRVPRLRAEVPILEFTVEPGAEDEFVGRLEGASERLGGKGLEVEVDTAFVVDVEVAEEVGACGSRSESPVDAEHG
jgi:hypothetical protein